MTGAVDLKVDWCSYEAAKYAVMHWHYSKSMPKSKLARLGVWENDVFLGVIIFGVGATADLVKRFGLDKWKGCELVRIALREHGAPVSQIIPLSIKKLRGQSPGLRLIVSYADPEHGHNGAIYQASNYKVVMGSSKYRYLYPLDRAMRRQIEPLRQPYPKRAGG